MCLTLAREERSIPLVAGTTGRRKRQDEGKGEAVSQAIENAKSRANDTEYVRRYGPDETYWTHFLDASEATSADYREALTLVERVSPEATNFLAHLRTMVEIKQEDEDYRTQRAYLHAMRVR